MLFEIFFIKKKIYFSHCKYPFGIYGCPNNTGTDHYRLHLFVLKQLHRNRKKNRMNPFIISQDIFIFSFENYIQAMLIYLTCLQGINSVNQSSDIFDSLDAPCFSSLIRRVQDIWILFNVRSTQIF